MLGLDNRHTDCVRLDCRVILAIVMQTAGANESFARQILVI